LERITQEGFNQTKV